MVWAQIYLGIKTKDKPYDFLGGVFMNKTKIIILLVAIIIGIGSLIYYRNDGDDNNEMIQNSQTNETKIVLYFSNLETGELVKEYRNVKLQDIKNNMEETIIKELLRGPENIELVSTIPSGTMLNSILLENNKIIIDFSKEFKEVVADELKNLHKIYSVVNSLTEITEINEVEIKVEGENYANKIRL